MAFWGAAAGKVGGRQARCGAGVVVSNRPRTKPTSGSWVRRQWWMRLTPAERELWLKHVREGMERSRYTTRNGPQRPERP